ncbi:MAG: hypothetical protein SCM96_15565, partial [Acidobacteriota bacterium]|nr:hypothetical protein [Acidobacteriota bacterium]
YTLCLSSPTTGGSMPSRNFETSSKNGFSIYQKSTTDNPGCPEEIKIKKLIDSTILENKKL